MKNVLFAYNGEDMCFVHVLLAALDMAQHGMEARIVLEGTATRTAAEFADPGHTFNDIWKKVLDKRLVDGACKACSHQTGATDALAAQGIAFLQEMKGHPSLARYQEQGFTVLTF